MNTILRLNSSIFGDGGQSSRLADEFVAQFPQARVIARDLAKDSLPHLDAARFGAFLGITDVQFVYAEGLAISEASKAESVARARGVLRELTRPERIAA